MVPLLLLLRKPSEQTKCEYACGQRQQHDKMFVCVCVRVCMAKEKRCKINFPILNLVEHTHTHTHITIITTTSSHPDCLNLFFFSL